MDTIDTIGDAIAAARPAYDAMTSLAEDVEDEWSYINDLSSAWLDRLDAVADARGPDVAGPGVGEAVTALIDEVAGLDDPHRAIDWLSTFPQVLLIALGERP